MEAAESVVTMSGTLYDAHRYLGYFPLGIGSHEPQSGVGTKGDDPMCNA